mmetsp:Transcript_107/g.113  ORF Transcript_107/g.113 Transcript_107/m.113 type:complete len:110 (-) Transcript_107:194-523(-)
MKCLCEKSYLNDNIMEFYINYLKHFMSNLKKTKSSFTPQCNRDPHPSQASPDLNSRISVFSTFFYNSLIEKQKSSTDTLLKLVEKKKKLLNKEIVIFPINLNEEQHWIT